MNKPIDVVVTACPRAEDYLAFTLASAALGRKEGEQLHLVVDDPGGADSAWLPRLGGVAGTHLHMIAHNHELRHWRIFNATTTALRVAATEDRAMLLLQDDAVLVPGWRDVLDELTRDLRGGAVALWCGIAAAYGQEHIAPSDPPALIAYAEGRFYGNVALWVHPDTACDLRDYMDGLNECPMTSDDLAVRHFFTTRPWHQLYVVVPNLAEHIGEVSTDDTSPVSRRSACLWEGRR